jgi:hypothetical protein
MPSIVSSDRCNKDEAMIEASSPITTTDTPIIIAEAASAAAPFPPLPVIVDEKVEIQWTTITSVTTSGTETVVAAAAAVAVNENSNNKEDESSTLTPVQFKVVDTAQQHEDTSFGKVDKAAAALTKGKAKEDEHEPSLPVSTKDEDVATTETQIQQEDSVNAKANTAKCEREVQLQHTKDVDVVMEMAEIQEESSVIGHININTDEAKTRPDDADAKAGDVEMEMDEIPQEDSVGIKANANEAAPTEEQGQTKVNAIINRNINLGKAKDKPDSKDQTQTKVVDMGEVEVQQKCAGNSKKDKDKPDEEQVKVVRMAEADIQAEESGKSNADEERVKEQGAAIAIESPYIQPVLPTTTTKPSTNTTKHTPNTASKNTNATTKTGGRKASAYQKLLQQESQSYLQSHTFTRLNRSREYCPSLEELQSTPFEAYVRRILIGITGDVPFHKEDPKTNTTDESESTGDSSGSGTDQEDDGTGTESESEDINSTSIQNDGNEGEAGNAANKNNKCTCTLQVEPTTSTSEALKEENVHIQKVKSSGHPSPSEGEVVVPKPETNPADRLPAPISVELQALPLPSVASTVTAKPTSESSSNCVGGGTSGEEKKEDNLMHTNTTKNEDVLRETIQETTTTVLAVNHTGSQSNASRDNDKKIQQSGATSAFGTNTFQPEEAVVQSKPSMISTNNTPDNGTSIIQAEAVTNNDLTVTSQACINNSTVRKVRPVPAKLYSCYGDDIKIDIDVNNPASGSNPPTTTQISMPSPARTATQISMLSPSTTTLPKVEAIAKPPATKSSSTSTSLYMDLTVPPKEELFAHPPDLTVDATTSDDEEDDSSAASSSSSSSSENTVIVSLNDFLGEPDFHKIPDGIAKVTLPQGWWSSADHAYGTDTTGRGPAWAKGTPLGDFVIQTPIRQVLSGIGGIYEYTMMELPAMTVAEFRDRADKYRTLQLGKDDSSAITADGRSAKKRKRRGDTATACMTSSQDSGTKQPRKDTPDSINNADTPKDENKEEEAGNKEANSNQSKEKDEVYMEELARQFWRRLGPTMEHSIYGADMEGSLMKDDEACGWNVNQLETCLRLLRADAPDGGREDVKFQLPGVTTSYLYFGMWASVFAA